MGAVTAILYCARNSFDISSMILDSPFSDINLMVKDVAFKTLNIPAFLVSIALTIVSSSIKSRINTDLFELKPVKYVKKCVAPVVFISGQEDGLVRPERAKKMFDKYAGTKKIFLLSEGGHSDEREDEILEQCYDYIKKGFIGYQADLCDFNNLIQDQKISNNKKIRPKNLKLLIQYIKQNRKVYRELEKNRNLGKDGKKSGKGSKFDSQIVSIAKIVEMNLKDEKLKNGIDMSM
jgi:hypothetical protein